MWTFNWKRKSRDWAKWEPVQQGSKTSRRASGQERPEHKHISITWGKCGARVGWTDWQMIFSTKILLLKEEDLFFLTCPKAFTKSVVTNVLDWFWICDGITTPTSLCEMKYNVHWRQMEEWIIFSEDSSWCHKWMTAESIFEYLKIYIFY